MLKAELKSKIDKLWDLFWSGGIANPLTAIEQISYLLFMKRLDDKDINRKKGAKFAGKTHKSIFKNNNDLRWSHWRHFEAEEMLNHVRDKVFPFIKKLNSESENRFSAQMKDAVFIIPKPSLLVQAVEIIESLKIHEQNQDTQGDIYEYLLSELKTSGKNGQFRTPRHIIKMMCELVGPKVGQTVCDPACGTGGFLIGAYQYILKQHTSPELVTVDEEGVEHGLIGDKITSANIWKYLKSKTFYGFDFDSTMLRISAMNMALHGIQNPNIKYLDSISKNNTAENLYDVILANPPFKGNIDKNDIHEALSRTVKTTRTELLFVVQMMRLLKVGGQCAVIVPNGVLFRSDKAHTAIRKKIIEEAQLEAVISMPSGVFKPYAGVSTAVLLFTKGGETDRVWFYDMTADGFSLDDKRDKIEENDIPNIIGKWNQRQKLKEPTKEDKWFFVDKKKIVESGDYSLTGRMYKETVNYGQTKWPMVKLGDVCQTTSGGTPLKTKKEYYKDGSIPWLRSGEVAQGLIKKSELFITQKGLDKSSAKIFPVNTVLVAMYGATAGQVGLLKFKSSTNQAICGILPNENFIPEFLFMILKNMKSKIIRLAGGGAQPNISQKIIKNLLIPLTPLEVQEEIVTEVEGYQTIIDGAKQIVENWKPTLKIDPSWSMMELEDICDVQSGGTPKRSVKSYWDGQIPWVGSTVCKDKEVVKAEEFITEEGLNNSSAKLFKKNTTLLALVGATIGKTGLLRFECATNQNIAGLFPKNPKKLNPIYLFYSTQQLYSKFLNLGKGKFRMANLSFVRKQKIPLPSFEIQEEVVSEIEKEKTHLKSCKELIKINTERIQQKINTIWRNS